LQLGNITLNHGDRLRIEKRERLELNGIDDTEMQLFDLPEEY
jgi:hypothetical protein